MKLLLKILIKATDRQESSTKVSTFIPLRIKSQDIFKQ